MIFETETVLPALHHQVDNVTLLARNLKLKLVEACSCDSDPPNPTQFDQELCPGALVKSMSAAGSETYKAMAADLGCEVGMQSRLPVLPAMLIQRCTLW